MEAVKTWRSTTSAYNQYMIDTIYPTFVGSYLAQRKRRGQKVIGTSVFLGMFDGFASEAAKLGTPVTLSSYIRSGYCSILKIVTPKVDEKVMSL